MSGAAVGLASKTRGNRKFSANAKQSIIKGNWIYQNNILSSQNNILSSLAF